MQDPCRTVLVFPTNPRRTKKLKWIRNIPDFIDVDNIRALMRLGRHSGAECVTIKQYREINSTTHWLASDERKPVNKKSLRPFGWAVLLDAAAVRKQECEAEKKLKEAQRRQAELEAMSPEELDIIAVREPDANESRVVQIYNRIDQFPDNLKCELAEALKAYWIKHGKWNKKKNTFKQKQKVAKVKAVLNENHT